MIYEKETENNESKVICESNRDNMEMNFLSSLSEKVCEILDVNWKDRQNMKNLFVSCLKSHVVEHKKGILFQYEQYLFDEAIKRLKKELNINSEINYNYALHARLIDIVDEIKKKLG